MPDDEQPQETNESSDFDAGYSDSGAAPDFAPDHDSDQQNPKPGSDEQDQLVTPKQMQDKMQAFQEGLNWVINQQRANQADHFGMMRKIQQMQEEANRPQPEPPQPYTLPAPPDQQQKNTIAVLATNILKWGALAGLAYGLTRRSPIRGAMFKLAMRSALQSYYEGNTRNRNQAVKAWEDNLREVNEQNKDQLRMYEDTMKNKHTSFQEKMDLMKAQAAVWRNDRMEASAIAGDIQKVQTTYKDMVKMQQDFQKQQKKMRDEWYKLFGMTAKEGYDYREWVLKKSNGAVDIHKVAGNTDKELEIEKQYPRSQMIEEQEKAQDQRKFEEFKRQEDYKAKLKAEDNSAGTKDNPLGLNLGE